MDQPCRKQREIPSFACGPSRSRLVTSLVVGDSGPECVPEKSLFIREVAFNRLYLQLDRSARIGTRNVGLHRLICHDRHT